jgi:hypothetical protein
VKKARYAFAAAGVAPTLGLLAPVAAPAITHAQVHPAKTVRLDHATTIPQYTCHKPEASGSNTSRRQLFYFQILRYGHCVDSQHASLHKLQKSLTEKLWAYSEHGALIDDRSVGETVINRSITEFPNSNFSALNWNGVYEICAALVSNSTSNVRYGPLCLQL